MKSGSGLYNRVSGAIRTAGRYGIRFLPLSRRENIGQHCLVWLRRTAAAERFARPKEKLEVACFPNAGLVSLVVAMENGKAVEAGVSANEKAAHWRPRLLNAQPAPEMVQVAGDRFWVKVQALQAVLKSAPEFQMILSRYTVVGASRCRKRPLAIGFTTLTAARALALMTQDNMKLPPSTITHDFLSTMLGTGRPSVSLAAGVLQRKKYMVHRGAVKVLNRKKLESPSCECYAVIHQYNAEIGLR